MTYRPSQRQVRVEVLAPAGWVSGVMHPPLKSSLAAYLNKKCEFLPMTEVPLDPGEPPLAFLAMRREAMLLVVPDPRDIEEHACVLTGHHVDVRVRCLFADTNVEGTAKLLGGLRVSDFLETNPGFILLSDCSVSGAMGSSHAPHVVVNTARMLAVTEVRTGPPAHEDRAALAGAGAGTDRSSR